MKKTVKTLSLILAAVLTLSVVLAGCTKPEESSSSIVLLPEPKVTVVKSQNDSVKTALDLTAEWDKVATPGTLIQSCVIIRKEFADNNPEAVKAFLEEYKASVNYVNADPQAAAELIAQAGIIPKAPLALKAIPGSNIKYMDGSEMKASLSEFYNILYSVEPKSIGGKLPDASLYYDANAVQTTGTADKDLNVNITVLSGTTGMGMAKLMADAKAGNAALSYNFNVISDPTQINAGIIGGTIDIAAAPTNLASVLHSKTNGGVYVLATSALGVLYVLETGESVKTVADLKGKTIYLPGQGTNPEYILKYIIEKNNLVVGKDVIFDYTYNTPDTLAEAISSGVLQ